MPKFSISNSLSGVYIGDFEAESKAAALDLYAQEAGYKNYAHACDIAPVKDGEIVVEEVESVYLCLAMRDSQSVRRNVDLIANAPICEGVEGVEFSAEQLAGQWAAAGAIDSDTALADIDEEMVDAHLDFVRQYCADENEKAVFDHAGALAHGFKIIKARQAETE